MTNESCWIHLSGIFAAWIVLFFIVAHSKQKCSPLWKSRAEILPVFATCSHYHLAWARWVVGDFFSTKARFASRGRHKRCTGFMQQIQPDLPRKTITNNFKRDYVRVAEMTGAARTAYWKRMPRFKTPSLKRKDKEKARKWHLPPTLSFNWTRRKLECISISQSKSFLMLILRKKTFFVQRI